MASLGFGIVGGVIGAFFGMPQLGFVLGSVLGTLLFPPKGPPGTEGPRLGDLSVMISSYGAAIPKAWGTFRMAGNVIWGTPIVEQKLTTKVKQGKGFLTPSTTETTYNYYGNFQVAFAQGPASGVVRIWADKKIIYDGRANAGGLVLPGLNFRFYGGSEEEVPDSIVEANVGAGLAPGNRGICTIVFDTLPLAAFGNRIPSIEAEIAFDSNEANTSRAGIANTEGIFASTPLGSAMAVDRSRRLIYTIGSGGTGDAGLRIFNMDTLVEIRQRSQADIFANSSALSAAPSNGFNFEGGFTVGGGGFIYTGLGDSNYDPIVSIDPNVLMVAGHGAGVLGDFGNLSGDIPAVWSLAEASGLAVLDPIAGLTTPRYLAGLTLASSSLASKFVISQDTDFGFLPVFGVNLGGNGGDGTSLSLTGATQWPVLRRARGIAVDYNPADTEGGAARWWVGDQELAGGNTSLAILRYTIDESGFNVILKTTLDPAAWFNDAAAGTHAIGPIVDQRDGGLLFLVQPSNTSGCYVLKWADNGTDGGTGTNGLQWVLRTETGWPQDENTICHESQVSSSRFGFFDGTSAALIDTSVGKILVDQAVALPSGWEVSVGQTQFYDGDSQSVYTFTNQSSTGIGQIYLGRVTGESASLDAIVGDISSLAGLKASQIDVSRLTSTDVQGFALAQQMAASDALQPLLTAYVIDTIETDGKVVFVPRGNDSAASYTKSDLMFDSDSASSVFQETRMQEWELPQSLSINFIDPALDYQPNSVSVSRVGAPAVGTIAASSPDAEQFQVPTITVGSVAAQAANLAIVMGATEAVQLAERLLYTAWNERMSEAFRGSISMLERDPGDVITVDLENGTVLTLRLTKATLNADYSTNFQATVQDKTTLVATKTSLGGFGMPQQVPPGQGKTQLFVFDIPLLRDIDDTNGVASRLYVGMNGYTNNWPGGVLWRSTDGGATYALTGTRAVVGCANGYVVGGFLPATDAPFQTDRKTALRVVMNEGELESETQSNFLNNANVAIIGDPFLGNWEVVLFRDAVQQDDGSYLVSTIMRGRRGTEGQVNTHGTGEFIIVPTAAAFSTYVMALNDLGDPAFFRGVGLTELVEDADTVTLTPRGNDLKPYAPCHLKAAKSGSDIAITWVRRNRTLGGLRDLTGTVPMTEATESYSIDIFNGSSVVRTLTATSPTVTYTSANITADFGSLPATLTFAVYQISAAIGRGFQAKTTITL
jgi:hypothetical protein